MNGAPEWLTIREVAFAWRKEARSVADLIRQKKLPASKIGGQWLVRPEDKAAYEQAQMNVTPIARRTSRPRRRAS